MTKMDVMHASHVTLVPLGGQTSHAWEACRHEGLN